MRSVDEIEQRIAEVEHDLDTYPNVQNAFDIVIEYLSYALSSMDEAYTEFEESYEAYKKDDILKEIENQSKEIVKLIETLQERLEESGWAVEDLYNELDRLEDDLAEALEEEENSDD